MKIMTQADFLRAMRDQGGSDLSAADSTRDLDTEHVFSGGEIGERRDDRLELLLAR